MGFLDKLWDETLAGPAPDSGLGRLRKYKSFSGSRLTVVDDPIPVPISRSITMLRSASVQIPNVNVSADSGSVPSSPTASSVPTTPQSPTSAGGNFKKITRRKSTPAAVPQGQPRSPTGYDWIVLSGLDR